MFESACTMAENTVYWANLCSLDTFLDSVKVKFFFYLALRMVSYTVNIHGILEVWTNERQSAFIHFVSSILETIAIISNKFTINPVLYIHIGDKLISIHSYWRKIQWEQIVSHISALSSFKNLQWLSQNPRDTVKWKKYSCEAYTLYRRSKRSYYNFYNNLFI